MKAIAQYWLILPLWESGKFQLERWSRPPTHRPYQLFFILLYFCSSVPTYWTFVCLSQPIELCSSVPTYWIFVRLSPPIAGRQRTVKHIFVLLYVCPLKILYILLGTCYLILVTQYLLLDICFMLLVTWYLLLDNCYWMLVTGYLFLDTCYLILDTC